MKEITKALNLVANASTLIYTVPRGYEAIMNMMYIHNEGTSTKTFTATWHKNTDNTDIKIMYAVPLLAKQYLVADDGVRIVMSELDTLTLLSETGSTMNAICTFELVKKEGI